MENLSYKNENIEKKRKNTWYNWFIDYIPESIRKIAGGFKDKDVSLFKTNTPKQIVYGRGEQLSKPKTQKQFEENIIKSIRNIFILKKENKEIKDRINNRY